MKKLRITVEGRAYEVEVELLDDAPSAPSTATAPPRPVTALPATSAPARPVAPPTAAPARPMPASAPGDVVSQLAGRVIDVKASVGQKVTAGEVVVILEAMKMNTPVEAPRDGTVTSIHVKAGDIVEEGQSLFTLTD